MKRLITACLIIASSQPAMAKGFDLNDAIGLFDDTKKLIEAANIDLSFLQEEKASPDNPTETSDPKYTAKPPFHKFYSAKKEIAKHLHKHPYTFYTNCEIKFSGKGKFYPDLRSCNYESRGDKTRARRIEFEHILPASWASDQFKCWDNGGRKNCQKSSKSFQALEADPVNLVPSVGEVNGNRSNYRFAELTHGFDYGTNGAIRLDSKARKFMPPESKKGWIGRVHLYMHDKYNIKYSSSYEKMMIAWAKKPASQAECDYNNLTKSWGYNNAYTANMCN
ncbi:endonuclease [Vibrio coralliirubri]|uniref:endonuclease n=1 Tax=Vibrio coralliirubri TaxID=1516159 RepID=UPI0022844349|nr:endonuclease [Vibrio coralliirubri]MCY9861275.1 endonuclease [Vibrio coralliirubri]